MRSVRTKSTRNRAVAAGLIIVTPEASAPLAPSPLRQSPPPRPREPRLALARCLQEDAPAAEATSERPTLLGFPIPGVGRVSADRGHLARRHRPFLPSPRSRRDLRRGVPPAREGHADPRSPHGRPEPLAESLRTPDRIDQARLSRPRHRPERAPPASRPDWLFRVLPPHPNPPFPNQGCTGPEAGRAAGAGQGRANPRSRWPASSIRPASGSCVSPGRPSAPPPLQLLPRDARSS